MAGNSFWKTLILLSVLAVAVALFYNPPPSSENETGRTLRMTDSKDKLA